MIYSEEFLSTASTEIPAPYINALWVKKKDVNRKQTLS